MRKVRVASKIFPFLFLFWLTACGGADESADATKSPGSTGGDSSPIAEIDSTPPTSVSVLYDNRADGGLSASPTLVWTSATDSESGIARYEISIGSAAGTSDIQPWTSVGTTLSYQIRDLNLIDGNTYYANIRAIDNADNTGPVTSSAGWVAEPLCIDNYVYVPGDSQYSSNGFCVAKYEMKNVGGVATSQASGDPWDWRDHYLAVNNCTDLGPNYHLINNDQWQTLARNIESVGANWSSGTVGIGAINQGHSDNSPSYELPADPNDNNACSGTGETCSATVWNSQRRTHILTSGEVIWDLAGNVDEWLNFTNDGTVFGSDSEVSQISSSSHTAINFKNFSAKEAFGPAGDYLALNTGSFGGLGYAILSANQSLVRGGSYLGNAGIFATNTNAGSNLGSRGFRCAYTKIHYSCADKTIGEACEGTAAINLASFNGLFYMTTPGGCTDSPSPTCSGGTDSVEKTYGTAGISVGSNNNHDGAVNTALLSEYSSAEAAKYCDDLTYGGFDDWYLPSRYETTNLLYSNKALIGGIDTSRWYWTSTEKSSDSGSAGRVRMADGYYYADGSNTKNESHLVRCIRKQ